MCVLHEKEDRSQKTALFLPAGILFTPLLQQKQLRPVQYNGIASGHGFIRAEMMKTRLHHDIYVRIGAAFILQRYDGSLDLIYFTRNRAKLGSDFHQAVFFHRVYTLDVKGLASTLFPPISIGVPAVSS